MGRSPASFRSAEGALTITGRRKDLIIRGGENIAAPHVENVLLRHPAIRDVAVCGRPDADLGEIVAAAVVLDPASPVTVAGTQGTVSALDDTSETFGNGTSGLTPGTYTCTVIVDP